MLLQPLKTIIRQTTLISQSKKLYLLQPLLTNIIKKNLYHSTNLQLRDFSHSHKKPATKYLDGDWTCGRCGNHNFRKRTNCNSCDAPKEAYEGESQMKLMRGDWLCVECDFHNFAYRSSCMKCNALVSDEGLRKADAEMVKKGDWECNGCGAINFSFRKSCFKCKEEKVEEMENLEGEKEEIKESEDTEVKEEIEEIEKREIETANESEKIEK